MQGQVAETVDLVRLALVHRVLPVDLEKALQHGSHLVHVIHVESDDAQAEDVGDVADVGIFPSLLAQLPLQGRLRLDAVLDGGDDDPRVRQEGAQALRNLFRKPPEYG